MIDLDRHTSDADPAALFIDGQQMSLVPNIRYGTAEYPERVARRLRAANIAASIGFSCSAFFAVWRFFDGSAHWKYVSLVALGYAVVPLLHRFGALAAPLALVAIFYTWNQRWSEPSIWISSPKCSRR